MSENQIEFFATAANTISTAPPEGPFLAISRRAADPATQDGPGLVWFGGFRSDLTSSKAVALDGWCAERGRTCLRFDYSGHGRSAGAFADGTIGQWFRDALQAFRELTRGPQIIVGSSMGAWITLLVARELARCGESHRLAGLVLIAPATDFTEALMWSAFPQDVRAEIIEKGQWLRTSPYGGDPYPITRALIEDGRDHLLLDSEIRTFCPVHILQGMQDPDVPWAHAMLLVEHLTADPVSITMIKDGDHRLSRPEDIVRLLSAVAQIA